MQTLWRAFTFSVSIGIPSIRLIYSALVAIVNSLFLSYELETIALRRRQKVSKAGLLLFSLTALLRLDPAFQ